jgi:hypothetical protein
VSIFAFTPTPQVIKVQLLAIDTEPVHIGDRSSKAELCQMRRALATHGAYRANRTGEPPEWRPSREMKSVLSRSPAQGRSVVQAMKMIRA